MEKNNVWQIFELLETKQVKSDQLSKTTDVFVYRVIRISKNKNTYYAKFITARKLPNGSTFIRDLFFFVPVFYSGGKTYLVFILKPATPLQALLARKEVINTEVDECWKAFKESIFPTPDEYKSSGIFFADKVKFHGGIPTKKGICKIIEPMPDDSVCVFQVEL